jgi:hypothetical protein
MSSGRTRRDQHALAAADRFVPFTQAKIVLVRHRRATSALPLALLIESGSTAKRAPANAARAITCGTRSSWRAVPAAHAAYRSMPHRCYPWRPTAARRSRSDCTHLEFRRAIDHVLERQRPRRAVAARIAELARSKLRRQHVLHLGLDVGDVLAERHSVALRLPRHAIWIAAHHVDGDQQPEIAHRCREILPGASGSRFGGAQAGARQ